MRDRVPPFEHPNSLLSSHVCLCVVELSRIQLSRSLNPMGVACTPSGVLIVTCHATNSVYAVDPTSGRCQLIAGSTNGPVRDGPGSKAVFSVPIAVDVAAPERCAYVSDYFNHCIRKITLPPEWFIPKASKQAASERASFTDSN